MNYIKLNFINKSNDTNNSEVVIFQKNVAADFDELAVAWTVIQNAGPGWSHPFNYPLTSTLAVSDSYGNYSPQLTASNGQLFSVEVGPSGNTLVPTGTASSPTDIEILNALQTSSLNANVYKDGKLLAIKTGVAPGQKAVFQFKPTIWIGVVSQMVQGDIMNSAIISQINTEISLLGIASADIVMTGGGPGTGSTAFNFTLENVQYA